ncbi:alpha/beta fold hydrolase [Patulibacter sp.]|uniref:alpha/beta fold hydrolase n=1 Tax=Patulibacter sp. TaxID=1912859 RepID=UPI002723E263|nr:alpha/beta hydrolase [Patulibacter sp.]MDO9409351.1 alpha/beta hydrolase [Patulibacter sp.]
MPSIDVSNTTLHYTDSGPRDAPAVLLSHSLFFDHTMFDAQVEHLSGTYRVVAYDHRGQGGSAPAPRDELDMDTLTADAVGLIEALGLRDVTVVGNSMGGFIALRLAARHPELVRSAVVAGSSADVEEQIEAFAPLVEALATDGVAPLLDPVSHIMLGDTSLSDPSRADLLRHVQDDLRGRGPSIADAAHQVVFRDGILDELGSITCPVLVLAGTEDHAYPPPKSRQIAEGVPDATLEVVEAAGHSVCLERPDVVNALIDAHLASLPAAAARDAAV